jgi:hypothetical protein
MNDQEKTVALARAYGIISLRFITVGALALLGVIAAVAAHALLPLVSGLILAALVVIYNAIGYAYLKGKETSIHAGSIISLSFALLVFDTLVITCIVCFTGGILSPFAFVYLVFPAVAGMLFPDRTYLTLSLSLFIIFLYEILLTMIYYGMIPNFPVIQQGLEIYQDLNLLGYFRFIFPVAIFIMLFCVNDLLSHLIKEKNALSKQVEALRRENEELKNR